MTCALVDIADRKEMEEKLRISSEESRIAYQLTDKLMYIYDAEKKQLHQPKPRQMNLAFRRLWMMPLTAS